MATLLLSPIRRIIYSTMGVFPDPPAIRLPTEITGIRNFSDGKILRSNSKLRNLIASPYRNERGRRKNLKSSTSQLVLTNMDFDDKNTSKNNTN
jgi:hypothetical protein